MRLKKEFLTDKEVMVEEGEEGPPPSQSLYDERRWCERHDALHVFVLVSSVQHHGQMGADTDERMR